eukprot:4319103-Amphidinium_carterae.1
MSKCVPVNALKVNALFEILLKLGGLGVSVPGWRAGVRKPKLLCVLQCFRPSSLARWKPRIP